MQRVGGEVGGVAADRAEAAELGVDRRRIEQRRLGQGRAVEQLRRGGAGGPGRAAALGRDADVGQPPGLDPQRELDDVAADGAPAEPAWLPGSGSPRCERSPK